jgi:hypothetical protein
LRPESENTNGTETPKRSRPAEQNVKPTHKPILQRMASKTKVEEVNQSTPNKLNQTSFSSENGPIINATKGLQKKEKDGVEENETLTNNGANRAKRTGDISLSSKPMEEQPKQENLASMAPKEEKPSKLASIVSSIVSPSQKSDEDNTSPPAPQKESKQTHPIPAQKPMSRFLHTLSSLIPSKSKANNSPKKPSSGASFSTATLLSYGQEAFDYLSECLTRSTMLEGEQAAKKRRFLLLLLVIILTIYNIYLFVKR